VSALCNGANKKAVKPATLFTLACFPSFPPNWDSLSSGNIYLLFVLLGHANASVAGSSPVRRTYTIFWRKNLEGLWSTARQGFPLSPSALVILAEPLGRGLGLAVYESVDQRPSRSVTSAFHSRASRCASAICAGVILAPPVPAAE
jgi:hypothetical protein